MKRSTRRPAVRMLSLPAALFGCCVLSAASLPVLAQETGAASAVVTHFYDLPAAPLAQTLNAIARASGRMVAFDPAEVGGMRGAPVKGNLSGGAAVAQALAGTGLTLNEDGRGTLAVMLPTVVVAARRDQAETSFKADRSDTATRSGVNLNDVPGSVTLITSKVIESQQITSITDVLRNVSGIKLTQSPQSTPTFAIRGFTASATSNGVVDGNAAMVNVFGVERVEVLKGPQAILAGSNALGGDVNVVTKKPQAGLIRDLVLQYGSGGDKTAAADLSGALAAGGKLTYRLIGAVSRAERNYAGYDGRKDDYLLPQFRWKDERTDFIAGASYGSQFMGVPGYTFARRDGVILAPPGVLLSNPADGIDTEQKKVFYQLEQKLSPSLLFISRMQRSLDAIELHLSSPGGLTYAAGAAPSNPNPDMNFSASRSQTGSATTSGDHYVRASFATWGVRHKLSVGLNHSEYAYNQTQWSGRSLSAAPYGSVNASFPPITQRATTLSSVSEYGQSQKALFVQEFVTLGAWNLLLNGRRTLYKLDPSSTNYVTANFIYNTPGRTVGANTPGAGVVYKVDPNVSLYASYGEGFNPQAGTACGGGIVAPIETTNKELGAKFDLLDSKLSFTTSAFSLQQSNQLRFNPLGACYDVRDSKETRGVELDLQGSLARGWDIIGNYTYTSVRDVGDAAERFNGEPRHKASLWTSYRFQHAALRNVGVGVGVSANSKNLGTTFSYPFTVPGQAQFDANLSYQGQGWSLVAGVKNLADRVIYGTSTSSAFVPVLPGRQFMVTFKQSLRP